MTQNQLISSSSAYLRSASHQPIDWYEFGDAAFQRAKDLDRLILLDIGATWCHWCHVIDRESYENEEIARLINENYVPVKVDRDQRPDIDARYQQIISAMTGQGGWPLTAILTYDGRVLFGGTYFPPGTMKRLLEQLSQVYREQKTEIMKESLLQLSPQELQQRMETTEAEAQQPIPLDVFHRILNAAANSFDPVHGGFGIQPKFPHFSTLEFLIQQAYRTQNHELITLVEQTLTEMAHGGIYDHIGGGFHRYSVDREWHVPHFEKMAYDNAEALKIYAQAYRLQKNPLYLAVVEGILRFTAEVLSDQENGGFYASQDADIDLNDDGDYFTWTLDEVRAVLTPEEADVTITYFDMTPTGDMHDRPGRNVLRVKKSLGEVAEALHQPVQRTKELLNSAMSKLAEKRRTRPTPFVDTTPYLNWNGMYLISYFETADLLDKPEVRQFAQKTLERLLNTHVDTTRNRLLHAEGVIGMLDDYAWMIGALIRGYQSTEETRYLEAAKHWTDIACEEFEDSIHGGFYDIPAPTERSLALLKFRRKPTEDTPTSSANAVMTRNLIQLNLITGEETYLEKAEKALKMFGQELAGRGLYASALGISLFEYLYPPAKLQVLGQSQALTDAAKDAFSPGKVITYVPEATENHILVCEGMRCLAPVADASALEEELRTLVLQTSQHVGSRERFP